MKTMAGLITRLLQESFDTNTPVSAGWGNDTPHYTIDAVDVVEDDQSETGHRLVLRLGVTLDSAYRLMHDKDQLVGDETLVPTLDKSTVRHGSDVDCPLVQSGEWDRCYGHTRTEKET